ncbi:MAG TPA: hypothetical protein VI199_04710 [Novosphingobium sp.]
MRIAAAILAAVVLTAAAPPPSAASPLAASKSGPATEADLAGALLTTARVTAPRRAVCGAPGANGEIVVCGADHGERWRVPSTTDSDPESHQATNTGVPQAPGLSSLPDCRHHCIGFGGAPPPLYVIDLRRMPAAPEGSDADLIAKGELSER